MRFNDFFRFRRRPPMARHFGLTIGDEVPRTEVPNMVRLEITAGKARLLTVNPVDDHGRPAPVDGPVGFDVLDGPVRVVRQTDNSAYLVAPAVLDPANPVGSVKLSADANLAPDDPQGGGKTMIEELVEATVVSPHAAALGVTLGDEIDAANVPGDTGPAAARAPKGKK